MPMAKVKKTGVYRAKGGHGTFLREGDEVDGDLLDNYAFDAEGTARREQRVNREPDYFRGVREARALSGAPENKAMGGYNDMTVPQLREVAASRGIEVGSDAKKADIVAALEAAGGQGNGGNDNGGAE